MTTLKTVIPPPTAILAVPGKGFQGGLVMADVWYKWFDQFNSNINQLNVAVAAMGVWTAFTPTVTPNAGSITTSSSTGAYTTINNLVLWKATLTITTNGTGSGFIKFNLPVAPLEPTVAFGRDATTGLMLQGYASVGGSVVMAVLHYDNTYPAADGSVLQLSGFYRI